jgi:hypothetical protein
MGINTSAKAIVIASFPTTRVARYDPALSSSFVGSVRIEALW